MTADSSPRAAARVPDTARTASAVIADVVGVAFRLVGVDDRDRSAPAAAREVLTEALNVVHAHLDPAFVGRQEHTPYMKALACAAVGLVCAGRFEPGLGLPGAIAHIEGDLRFADDPGDGRAATAALAGHAEQLARLLEPDVIDDANVQERAIAAVALHVAVNAIQHARTAATARHDRPARRRRRRPPRPSGGGDYQGARQPGLRHRTRLLRRP
jgi:hypothetical protein